MAGAGREDESPVGADEFAAAMRAFEPFEPAPVLAVGVSGGADSLALTLLLQSWCAPRGGSVIAFTLDHGLRADSADEARRVGEILRSRHIAHRILEWRGPKPGRVRQQHARAARYARLGEACAEHGILHLAMAHHQADRAETLLLRIRAGSGMDGLAGMAGQRELSELRVIRPLLGFPKRRLEATLRERGVSWIEDPSNRNPDFLRVQIRMLLPELARAGLTVGRLNRFSELMGRARRQHEGHRADLLGRALELHPAGFARLDPQALEGVPEPVSQAALARVLMCIGGALHPPRGVGLERLVRHLGAGAGGARTLGGCRIVPRRGRWLVVREWERGPVVPVGPGQTLLFDGRFEVRVADRAPDRLRLGYLGERGWRRLSQARPELRDHPIPPPARGSLPALFDGEEPVAACPAARLPTRAPEFMERCDFAPRRTVTSGRFTVA